MSQLIVLSSFPDEGEIHSAQTVGVASYTKNLLLAMSQLDPELGITVIAEDIAGYHDYQEGSLDVIRFWRRGNFQSLWRLILKLSELRSFPILVEFEINEFGSPLHTCFVILGLCLLRALGAQITIVMHQVVGDFTDLEGQTFWAALKNITATVFYFFVKLAATKVIVFETELKTSLGGRSKIDVVPHFVTPAQNVDRQAARERLGWDPDKKYALCFGFIAPYKGIKQLLEIWPDYSPYTLVIAGGINPNHTMRADIVDYVRDVEGLAKSKNITVTGFVPENQMPDYFAACDVMIFPYRSFLSSSGPLSFAFTYGRPVMLSAALAPYAQTPDFAAALAQNNLTLIDIVFEPTATSLLALLHRSPTKASQLSQFARDVATSRSLDRVALDTANAIAGLHLTMQAEVVTDTDDTPVTSDQPVN